MLPQLLRDRGEGGAAQRFCFQDRKPNLYLVEPGSPRRCEVEVHVLVTRQPTIDLRLMGLEIVEDDMDGTVSIREKPATMSFMKARNSICRRRVLCAALNCCRRPPQRRRTAWWCHCACNRGCGRSAPGCSAVSDSPGCAPAPGSKVSFVDADDDRILGRRHIEQPGPHRRPWRQTRDRCFRTTTLRPARSIFAPAGKRQTCCSCTSPSSAAIKGPVPARELTRRRSRSRTARTVRRPVSAW